MSRLPRLVALCSLGLSLVVGGCATPRTYAPAYSTSAPAPAGAAAYFWDDLSPYGEWQFTQRYGWVWSPYGVSASWQPYTYGRWAYSDYGWTWNSYYDWGWAPFHYGRWTNDVGYGWAWVPGRTWGPAWVAWRQGPSVIGWAPLPPSAVWRPGYGLAFGAGGLGAIGASWWVFTQPRYLTSNRVYAYTVPGYRAQQVFRRTRPVVRYDQGRHGVIHRGVDVDRVEERAGVRVPRVSAREVERTRAMAEERIERPARPLERPPVMPRNRDAPGPVRSQRPETTPPSRDPLRQPRARPELPDEMLRPERRTRPLPPFAERRQSVQPEERSERSFERRERPSRVRPSTPSRVRPSVPSRPSQRPSPTRTPRGG